MASDKLKGKIKDLDFKPRVLGQQVSQILTEAILEGGLKGGDQLIEAELQKQFGISRSPLREAFRDLEKKDLVVIVPRKGTFVKRLTRKDIEDNFPVRAILEGLAAREAYRRMSGQILEELAQALDKMAKAVTRGNIKLYWKNHLQFHDIFIKASGNDVLIKILKTLRMHSLWYRFSYQYYQEDLQRSLSVHQKILGFFQDQDLDPHEIGSLVEGHILTAFQSFVAYLDEQDSP